MVSGASRWKGELAALGTLRGHRDGPRLGEGLTNAGSRLQTRTWESQTRAQRQSRDSRRPARELWQWTGPRARPDNGPLGGGKEASTQDGGGEGVKREQEEIQRRQNRRRYGEAGCRGEGELTGCLGEKIQLR